MALRCFLFSSDEGTSDVIRQVLTGLDVEGEASSEAATAVDKITHELFQLLVIDWDQQPEASTLLNAARERKAAQRPLVLAIVNDDASVPQALQAGANSILRRPILLNQVRDTLTTARDLLRARLESTTTIAQAAVAAAASASASTAPASPQSDNQPTLHAGEFLSAPPVAPGGQFETDSETASAEAQLVADEARPLKDLEPVATSVPAPLPPPPPDEPKTLEELLRSRGVGRQAPPSSSEQSGKAELLGFDQTPSSSGYQSGGTAAAAAPARSDAHEKRQEAQLFSYITGESEEPKKNSQPRFRIRKGPVIIASVLASLAIVLAPQAPWHPRVQILWARGQRSLHAWLNPQPVTTPVAPTAHEDFGRAGDEYKLPVAEAIPDATTDPSQIHVVPVVDPTAKKPNNASASPDQPAVTETPTVTPTDSAQPPAAQVPDSQPSQPAPSSTQPAVTPAPAVTTTPTVAAPATTTPSAETPSVTYTPVTPTPAPPKREPEPYVPPPAPKVPSSLQSQMATMVPDASGNKPPEAAMQSIEPVAVPELAERALLNSQAPLDYPAAAGAQQGTVILQILIGRDGAVQDAKFQQGSLVFARSAIAGVKQWKFKPYLMNGRPVSVQTTLTIKFKPGQ